MVTLGIAIGGFIWAILTGFGLNILFRAYPVLLQILGIVGGVYLLWLGFKGWRAALTASSSDIMPRASSGVWQDIVYGFIITATNPKAALVWLSLSAYVGRQIISILELVMFAIVASVVLFLTYGAYGLFFSVSGIRRLYKRFQNISDGIFGTIFMLIGLSMLLGAML